MNEELQKVMGIGSKKAQELLDLGLTKISQLEQKRFKSYLSEVTILYLKYKPVTMIDRKIIEEYEPKFKKFFPNSTFAGSYRREKKLLSDVDVVMTSVIDQKTLEQKLGAIILSAGSDKIACLIPINNHYYKFDIFFTNHDEYAAMLLYTTGSKFMNIIMRRKAAKMGLKLNQHGLYKGNKQTIYPTEKEYFKALGMKYIVPKKRH